MQVGVEIGGTFTDLVWRQDDGAVRVGKVPSTPAQVEQAVMDAIAATGVPLDRVERLSHGSTIATNALLTRRGAVTGLLTTAGFRDVVEIGTHDRVGNIYTAFYHKPRPPVFRRHIREVTERLHADGSVITPIDLEVAWTEVEALRADGVQAIAVCLLHGYLNPVHEIALRDMILARAPELEVFTSHEVSPEFREYERSVTTTVNSFVGPVVKGYIDRLRGRLADQGFGNALRVIQSNGGMMPADAAGSNAVRMLLSGPAAGVRAAIWFARRNGIEDILTLDMGGTSTDVAIAPALTERLVPELTVDGLPIRSTAVDMITVGAGGGSIAAVDPGGFLAVGPASAGAVPGPACYGRGGTQATVTDAQVIAGILRPERFNGGAFALDTAAAQTSLRAVGLEGDLKTVADSVLRMVNSNMAAAVRLVSTSRGIDPRDFTLVAYGGGGPVHGAMVAQEIGMTRVLVPWSPGITSAFGLLVADLILDVVRSNMEPLTDASLDAGRVADLTRLCEAEAARLGLKAGDYEVQAGLDLRYAGQGYELTLWRDMAACPGAEIDAAFQEEHRQRYGYARPQLPTQVVNLRARIIQRNTAEVATPPAREAAYRETATLVLDGTAQEAVFLPRSALAPGQGIDGPAVLEEQTSTVLVPAGWHAACLDSGDLLLTRDAETGA
jgi:N-methylhydantoinase A